MRSFLVFMIYLLAFQIHSVELRDPKFKQTTKKKRKDFFLVCKKLKRGGADITCHPVNSNAAEKRTHGSIAIPFVGKRKFLSEMSRTASQFQWDIKSLEYLVRKASDQNLLKSYHDEFVKLRNVISVVGIEAETYLRSSKEDRTTTIKPTLLPTVTLNPLISNELKEKQNQRVWLTNNLLQEKQERLLTSYISKAANKLNALTPSVQDIEARLEEDPTLQSKIRKFPLPLPPLYPPTRYPTAAVYVNGRIQFPMTSSPVMMTISTQKLNYNNLVNASNDRLLGINSLVFPTSSLSPKLANFHPFTKRKPTSLRLQQLFLNARKNSLNFKDEIHPYKLSGDSADMVFMNALHPTRQPLPVNRNPPTSLANNPMGIASTPMHQTKPDGLDPTLHQVIKEVKLLSDSSNKIQPGVASTDIEIWPTTTIISNKRGSHFQVTFVVMRGFDERLIDETSKIFMLLKSYVEKEMRKLYSGDGTFISCHVNKFTSTPNSAIRVEVEWFFTKQSTDHFLRLQRQIKSGHIGNLETSPEILNVVVLHDSEVIANDKKCSVQCAHPYQCFPLCETTCCEIQQQMDTGMRSLEGIPRVDEAPKNDTKSK